MHTLAFWMPGPWELAICAVMAMVAVGIVAALIVLAVVMARRKGESQPLQAPPSRDASSPPDAAAPSDTESSA